MPEIFHTHFLNKKQDTHKRRGEQTVPIQNEPPQMLATRPRLPKRKVSSYVSMAWATHSPASLGTPTVTPAPETQCSPNPGSSRGPREVWTTVSRSPLPAGTSCPSHPAWKGGLLSLHLTGLGTCTSGNARIPRHKQRAGQGWDGLP